MFLCFFFLLKKNTSGILETRVSRLYQSTRKNIFYAYFVSFCIAKKKFHQFSLKNLVLWELWAASGQVCRKPAAFADISTSEILSLYLTSSITATITHHSNVTSPAQLIKYKWNSSHRHILETKLKRFYTGLSRSLAFYRLGGTKIFSVPYVNNCAHNMLTMDLKSLFFYNSKAL